MFNIKQDFLPVNRYTRPGQKMSKVKGIVIHWTANENAGADDVAHRRYFGGNAISAHSYASAHYFVDSDSIVQIIPDNEMAYHVGASSYRTNRLGRYPNDCTIGVETCVNKRGEGFKQALEQSAMLCAKLLKENGLGIDDLYRHYDITGKDCPKYFVSNDYANRYGFESASKAWSDFKQEVLSYMKPAKPAKEPVKTSTAKPLAKTKKFKITKQCTVRERADYDAPASSQAHVDEVFTVMKKVKAKNSAKNGAYQYMYQLKSGLFITASPNYSKEV